jgi:flagellar biosynthesis/type III secretory pathway chaperone
MDVESSSSHSYQELCEGLDQLIKVYRHLLETVRKERDILVAAKLEELNENNKVKEAHLLRIRSLENARLKATRDLAAAIGLEGPSPRLLELAHRLSGEQGVRLRNYHSVLDLLVKRVSEVNKGNEDLVQQALKNISGAMEAIREELSPKATYSRTGATPASARPDSAGHLVSRDV